MQSTIQKVQNSITSHKKVLLIFIGISLLCEIFIFNSRSFELLGNGNGPFPEYHYSADQMETTETSGISDTTLKIDSASEEISPQLKSIYIEGNFHNDQAVISKIHLEEEGFQAGQDIDFLIIPGIEHSRYIYLNPVKPVKSITFSFHRYTPDSLTIICNKAIPIRINILRIILIYIFLLTIWAIRPASNIYRTPFDLHNRKQQAVLAGVLVFQIFMIAAADLSTYSDYIEARRTGNVSDGPFKNKQHYQLLTEALLNKSLSVSITPSDKLENLDNPYDHSERVLKNIPEAWDYAYYKGKYYVYYGIVPALLLFLPYKIITHKYLFVDFAVLLYSILGILGLTAAYTLMVQRWFKKLSAGFFFCGLFILLSSTGLIWAARRSMSYEVAITSGFCFSVCGLALILAAVRETGNPMNSKINPVLLILGSFCMACAVGCRPMTLFISLLLLPILIPSIMTIQKGKIRNFKWKYFLCVLIPYLIVGIFLAWYNYARFGSPFEFGIRYQITTDDYSINKAGLILPSFLIGIFNFFQGTGSHLISDFPFIEPFGVLLFGFNGIKATQNIFSIGEICPIFFFCFIVLFEKEKIKAMDHSFKAEFALLLFCSVVMAGLTFTMIGALQRYMIDFYWMAALAGLFAFFVLFQNSSSRYARLFLSLCIFVSIFSCMALSMGEPSAGGTWFQKNNYNLYQQVNYFFAFWK